MTMSRYASRIAAGTVLMATGLIAGASGASAQATAQYTAIQNQFGSTITLDTASCTGGTISPPFSITTTSPTFSGTTTGSSTLCTVRYQSGIYGCQFQISASSSGGIFASANAYKGSGGRPICQYSNDGPISGGWRSNFLMK
jgi:hypothetical protein